MFLEVLLLLNIQFTRKRHFSELIKYSIMLLYFEKII